MQQSYEETAPQGEIETNKKGLQNEADKLAEGLEQVQALLQELQYADMTNYCDHKSLRVTSNSGLVWTVPAVFSNSESFNKLN